MQIIPMEARHLDALAEIERLCFPVPWSAEQLREELGGNLFLVAEDETGVQIGRAHV